MGEDDLYERKRVREGEERRVGGRKYMEKSSSHSITHSTRPLLLVGLFCSDLPMHVTCFLKAVFHTAEAYRSCLEGWTKPIRNTCKVALKLFR